MQSYRIQLVRLVSHSLRFSQQRAAAAAILGLMLLATPAVAAVFIPLGDLPGFSGRSMSPTAVADDGQTVVGRAVFGSDPGQGWRYTSTMGMQPLESLGGTGSDAWDVSADGSVIVGSSVRANGAYEATLWTDGEAPRGLGVLGNNGQHFRSEGRAISSDGTIIAGISTTSPSEGGLDAAFRWTELGGMQSIGDVSGGRGAHVEDMSSDGSVIVGGSVTATFPEATRWTNGTGWESLGTPPITDTSAALATSGNGQTILGQVGRASSSSDPSFLQYTIWTQQDGWQLFEDASSHFETLQPLDISDDGSVIVGLGKTEAGFHQGFLWTAERGVVRFNDLLAHLGVDFNILNEIGEAAPVAISRNGRYVAGINPFGASGPQQAFLVDLGVPIPEPASASLLLAGVVSVVGAWRRG